jgi:hypothetical protein
MMARGFRVRAAPRTFLIALVGAAAFVAASVPASAGAAGPAAPTTECPKPSPDGCLADPWPSGPSKNSAAVAKAAFTHDYTKVWKYLHPSLQKAVKQASWQACQRRYPLSSPGVKIKSVRVADSKPTPFSLPLLGPQQVRTVTLQVLFTSPAAKGEQVALEFAYWVKDKGNWVAVWLPDQFNLYKSGKCDTGETRGLY